MDRKAIGARIEALRKVYGFKSQTDFATELGIGQSRLSQWESGMRLLPPEAAEEMRAKFHISLDWLYFGDTQNMPHGLVVKLNAISEPYRRDDQD